MENLLIISIKSVILTKNKKQQSVPDKDLGRVVIGESAENPHKYWVFVIFLRFRLEPNVSS